MVKLAYANDGISVYDLLFLKRLTKENTIYFLTFNKYEMDKERLEWLFCACERLAAPC